MRELFPEDVGGEVEVRYDADARRVIAVPLTVHILAPNHRPVQVTQDLAGFWREHYPRLKRELQRRYPKHEWREVP